ncbi:hypothetical protein AB6A40_010257 [Gnathostoma spinigerum]|uniref:Vacuolar protein sorting-associated protein 54 N-terminal domain-containing protein n=1 Tax=Gnathostoma spinigerum TaxID=75299 RepID=A0ABD6F1E5_9BILA
MDEACNSGQFAQQLNKSSNESAPRHLTTRCLPIPDPVVEADVLESIEAAYYLEDGFDATDFELKKMAGPELLPEDLMREMDRLKHQLHVVSKRISSMIVENSPSYSAELERVDNIQGDLTDVIDTVSMIRKNLCIARRQSRNGLEIIANHRNTILLKKLKSSLCVLKTLYDTEFQLNDLIQEGDFVAAIRLCEEARKVASNYSRFNCIRELLEKLSEMMENIEGELDNVLSSLTLLFDPDRYSSVYSAYKMLRRVDVHLNIL